MSIMHACVQMEDDFRYGHEPTTVIYLNIWSNFARFEVVTGMKIQLRSSGL